jgi:hypothetical protein
VSVVDENIIGGGQPTATIDQCRRYLRDAPDRLLTDAEIDEIVAAFAWFGQLVGIRFDVAFSMSAHETNRYRFGGQVALVQHNPAGIGATNDGAPGLTYADWRTGVAAMFVHLLGWCNRLDLAPAVNLDYRTLDPRLPLVAEARRTKGAATTWRSLGGRWAVPGLLYGDGIEKHHNAILALPAPPGEEKGPHMGLTIREAIIPAQNANRPKLPMVPHWLTVHETGNPAPTANAEMHRRFVANGGGEDGVSFHWVVDDKEAVHLIPDNENAWHASDGAGGTGNRQSVAIETCINAGSDWAATRRNLAHLIALLLERHGIPLANVVQHNRWAPDRKNCPTRMRANNQAEWKGLLAAVAALVKLPQPNAPRPPGWLNAGDADVFRWEGEGVIVERRVVYFNPEKGRYYEREWHHERGYTPWKEIA